MSAFHTTQLAIEPRWYITDLSNKIDSIDEITLELDLHADTCVLGRNALIFLHYDRPVIVRGMTLPLALRPTLLLVELLLMMTKQPAKYIT